MKGLCGCLLTIFLGVGLLSVLSSAQSVNVTTWRNDNGRTGQNDNETTLTIGNVNQTMFGKICSYALLPNEQVYAQPLVLASIMIGGTLHEAVYVVTMQDNIYVFDGANHSGTTCTLLQGPFPLIPSTEGPADCSQISNCGAISPTVGILGTPVIDASTNTLYVVTESQYPKTGTAKNWYHRVHALDLTSPTLAEKYYGPVTIPLATVGSVIFSSKNEIQRPGLLLTYEQPVPTYPTLYIAFSMMDGASPNPSGWIFGYDAHDLGNTTLPFPLIYATTPGAPDKNGRSGGGIWQSGAGLAAGGDYYGSNYIYFSTGDGQFDNPLAMNGNAGDSFVKLTTHLQVADYFAPADEYNRWDLMCNSKGGNDLDFGSGGVIVVPPDAHMNSAYQHVAIKADKENYLWVIDRTSPGKSNACVPNSCSCSNTDSNVIQKVLVPSTKMTRNTPAFWDDGTTAGPYLYFAPSYGNMSKYPLNCAPPGPICNPTASSSAAPPDALGFSPSPSISSDVKVNSGTGLVWVLTSSAGNPPLYAMDAETLNVLSTSHCPRDAIGPPTKFSVPTVANGKVFVGTTTDFDIFGPTTASCN